MFVVLRRSFLSELRDLGLYGVTNDPSFRNYGINTFVELRQSFLFELWDQDIYGTHKILPIGIAGSSQWSFLSELWDLGLYRVTNDPSFRNYGINTSVELRQSFLLELRDQFNELSTSLESIQVRNIPVMSMVPILQVCLYIFSCFWLIE